MKQLPTAGWYADPTQRHEYRYWTGSSWTEQVSDHGKVAADSIATTTNTQTEATTATSENRPVTDQTARPETSNAGGWNAAQRQRFGSLGRLTRTQLILISTALVLVCCIGTVVIGALASNDTKIPPHIAPTTASPSPALSARRSHQTRTTNPKAPNPTNTPDSKPGPYR